jgi:hypothetical protein
MVGKVERRDHSEELGIDTRIILEWILEIQDGKLWKGFIWLKIGSSGGEFPDYLSDC